MISNKGITLHWDQIVVLIVLVVGIALLLIFLGVVGEESKSMFSILIDNFKSSMCQIFGQAFGGLAGTLLGC